MDKSKIIHKAKVVPQVLQALPVRQSLQRNILQFFLQAQQALLTHLLLMAVVVLVVLHLPVEAVVKVAVGAKVVKAAGVLVTALLRLKHRWQTLPLILLPIPSLIHQCAHLLLPA